MLKLKSGVTVDLEVKEGISGSSKENKVEE